jgi:hypothetical protein
MPNEPADDDIKKRAEAAKNLVAERTGMQVLSDALEAQRNRAEDLWNAATAHMQRSWVPGRDADRRVTAATHEPERRRS